MSETTQPQKNAEVPQKKPAQLYPFSRHVFMFPFNWNWDDSKEKNGATLFSERTALNKFQQMLESTQKWKLQKGSGQLVEDYNDRLYFHTFTHDFVLGEATENNNPIVLNYDYIVDNLYYVFNVCGKEDPYREPFTYRLRIESITLSVYNTGVAILSFSLANENLSQHTLEHVLCINDYGRRISPQFLSEFGNLQKTQEAFLATYIALEQQSSPQTPDLYNILPGSLEDFKDFQDGQTIFKIPAFIKVLLGSSFTDVFSKEQEPKITITPVLDDRMFVVCWYGNNELAQSLSHSETDSNGNWTYSYETSEKWNQFIHIDNSGISSSGGRWLVNENRLRTYDRWAGYGTLYGVTRYSFVCLTNQSDFVTKIVKIPVHVMTRYAEMVRVALAQRATFLRFESEASRIASLRKESTNKLNQIRDLYQCYVEFINRGYFSTSGVTAQEQGIELFKMISREVEIEADLKYLREDLAELHTLADLESKQSVDKLTQKITFLTALVLIPSFLVSYLQYGFKIPQIEDINLEWWVIGLISLVTMVYLPLNTERIKEVFTRAHVKANWVYYLSFVIIGLLLLLPLIYQKLFSTHTAPGKKETLVPVLKDLPHKPVSKDTLTLKPH